MCCIRFIIVIISSGFIIEKHIPGSRKKNKKNLILFYYTLSFHSLVFCVGKYTENVIHLKYNPKYRKMKEEKEQKDCPKCCGLSHIHTLNRTKKKFHICLCTQYIR